MTLSACFKQGDENGGGGGKTSKTFDKLISGVRLTTETKAEMEEDEEEEELGFLLGYIISPPSLH